ncbi:bifunctional 4-hydroxy-2-oxoglutarate aldolase/2-dehydro-3-deoxy-phosphogluconate aldolase [Temperatibacter marinus]|uniref:2-dehydro-3-deoxy-phosphogluconate aldolase n=1 Tax=Temperatibacter marinus TaxID=1456591 RepID=A0AA52EJW5_9PROT|nr:bifunctional 4-hydroxy-2-oxoglutarate aldolase/2-dehydro-3-deoxy-phosphogluconate aldolase [Temperatibacter marinus]WND03867.1 bifunctional 4-hydroxy-2-oxoglutarate aldolase/2-dehydro-3-deoxy-phosphogluconate aldolase [Temperatibacter marinus]
MIYDKLKKMAVVPVVEIEDSHQAVPVAEALINAGLPVIEITFRTDAALEAIKNIADQYPSFLIGAGTISSVQQVQEAVDAGATFIVTPGVNIPVLTYCRDMKIPVIPGVCTPSDIERLLGYDLPMLKFFPAEAAGGVAMLKALAGPYGAIQFMPTGGISPENLESYLSCGNVSVCGGSWIAAKGLIQKADFEEIQKLGEKAVAQVSSIRAKGQSYAA